MTVNIMAKGWTIPLNNHKDGKKYLSVEAVLSHIDKIRRFRLLIKTSGGFLPDGYVQLGGDPVPKHWRCYTPHLACTNQRIPQELLGDVSGEKHTGLAANYHNEPKPSQPGLYSKCQVVDECICTLLQCVSRRSPLLWDYNVPGGNGHHCLRVGPNPSPWGVFVCLCQSVCVWQRLIKTAHQLCTADVCLSKKERAWQR